MEDGGLGQQNVRDDEDEVREMSRARRGGFETEGLENKQQQQHRLIEVVDVVAAAAAAAADEGRGRGVAKVMDDDAATRTEAEGEREGDGAPVTTSRTDRGSVKTSRMNSVGSCCSIAALAWALHQQRAMDGVSLRTKLHLETRVLL